MCLNLGLVQPSVLLVAKQSWTTSPLRFVAACVDTKLESQGFPRTYRNVDTISSTDACWLRNVRISSRSFFIAPRSEIKSVNPGFDPDKGLPVSSCPFPKYHW